MTATDADLELLLSKQIAAVSQMLTIHSVNTGLLAAAKRGQTTVRVDMPRLRIAVLGDDRVADAGQPLITSAVTSAPLGFTATTVIGTYNQQINTAGSDNRTTVQKIADVRVGGAEPDLWVLDLGANLPQADAIKAAKDISDPTAQLDTVLGALGASARVALVNIGTEYSYPSSYLYDEAVNAMFAQRVGARGGAGFVLDWWTYNRDHRPDSAITNTWWRDGSHMTAAGYTAKWTWIAAQLDTWLDSLATTTTVAPASGADPVYVDIASLITN